MTCGAFLCFSDWPLWFGSSRFSLLGAVRFSVGLGLRVITDRFGFSRLFGLVSLDVRFGFPWGI